MTTLFVEPFGGLAGDMFLAALLDLADPRFTLADLTALADALVPGEAQLSSERAWRGNLSGTHLAVRTPETVSPPHRTLADLAERVEASPLSPAARARSLAILRRIAVAEATVHGTVPEEIHFHEVGAVDTLIDVCGAALALERLEITDVIARPPLTGQGTVLCAHGEMPVPAPAVCELLRGRPMVLGGGEGERLTPTGAALLAELVSRFDPPGAFRAERVGYGAGTRDPDDGPPNLVRVQTGVVLALEDGARRTDVWQLAVDLDDMTGEEVAHAVARVRDAGALDVWVAPVQMKKGRPGVELCALARTDERDALEQAVLDATPTLGLRWIACERLECARHTVEVEVEGTAVRVKVRERPSAPAGGTAGGTAGGAAGGTSGRTVDARDLSPEHDDVARLATTLGVGLREAERCAIDAALAALAAARRA